MFRMMLGGPEELRFIWLHCGPPEELRYVRLQCGVDLVGGGSYLAMGVCEHPGEDLTKPLELNTASGGKRKMLQICK